MRFRSVILGTVLCAILLGIGLADYVLIEGPRSRVSAPQDPDSITPPSSSATTTTSSATSSTPTLVRKGTSTQKRTLPTVEELITALGLVAVPTSEGSILSVLAHVIDAKTTVLLRDNDRAFLLSWVESNDVKNIFSILKQTLQEEFSPNVSDLVDETRRPADGPPVDVLTFRDPAITSETVLFLRVRTRLYEIHVATGGAPLLDSLVATLSQ